VKSSEARSLAGRYTPASDAAEPEPDLPAALHEVSNALTVVLGWLDGARSGLPSSAEREAVEIALAHARLGYRIARRAIGADVSDIERDRNAAAVARDALLAVTPEARRSQVGIRFVDRGCGNEQVADAPSVMQILLNLLLNALSFSPSEGMVTLSLERDGDRLRFEVSDEGPGIPQERAEHLFAGPDSTRRGGAGIGLRHSAQIARASGGELALVRSLGGTTFALTWPFTEAASDSRQPASSAAALCGARVLVIEDDAAVLSLIELALGARGATVLAARSLEEVDCLLARSQPFSAALVDLSPLADRADQILSDLAGRCAVPVVLISGFASGVPEGLERHIRAWVRKPFEMGEIVQVLQSLIAPR
jgi:CheY-like chemotaxis protein